MKDTRVTTLGSVLTLAAQNELEDGWLYLPDAALPSWATPCLVHAEDRDAEETGATPAERGFPQEALSVADLEDMAEWARQFMDPPSDALLLESFLYYWRFDAFLPEPGAPDPPSGAETQARLEQAMYERLGLEREDAPCKAPGCTSGAVAHSVLCRIHHCEMLKRGGSGL